MTMIKDDFTAPVKFDAASATGFLRRFAPNGPWVLTAVGEGRSAPTSTFQPGEEQALARWIEARQIEGRNVYFLVGEPLRPLSKKAAKADMARTRWLHVDADARKDLDWSDGAAVEAELAALRARLDAFSAPPTVIVASGGGLQAFWRLKEFFELGGDPGRVAALEALNKGLADALGGDHCHNADRIMRLPGTVNFPNAGKRAMGRRPALARVAAVNNGLSYDLEAFESFRPKESPKTPPDGGALAALPRRLQRTLRAAPAAGDRSSAFFAACCALFEHGLPDAEALAALEAAPEGVAAKFIARGDLAAEVGRVRSKWRPKPAKAKARNGGEDEDGRKPTQADAIVALAREAASFFKAPDETAYAAIEVDGHCETWAVRSKGFKQWLTHRYFIETGRAPNADALNQAQATVSAMAQFGGVEARVFTRAAEQDGKLYVDLCDKDWRAIEIDAEGWRVVDRPPVRFTRRKGALALPEPERGSIDELRPLLNVASEDDFKLIVGWLLAALYPTGPYPLMALAGEPGTAKSSTAELLRSLVDPNVSPLRNAPKDERDLFISATASWMLVLDNLSSIPAALSDALCRVATGGGYSTRELHTNDDEVIFDVMRPVLITSVGEVIARSDLADRAVLVTLAAIPEERRKTKKAFAAELERARPRILAALLDGLSHGVRELPRTSAEGLPRMADFILLAQACEGAYWEPGAVAAAFRRNADDAVEGVLEGDLVAVALRAWFAARNYEPWRGKGEELLGHLCNFAPDGARREHAWPRNPQHLSSRLTLAAPSLRKAGVYVERGRDHGGRWISISAAPGAFPQ
jgi:hypothetical protein